jgi:D-alanine-D-alanine ligase
VSRVSASAVSAALAAEGYAAPMLEISGDLAQRLAECEPDVVFPTAHGPLGEDGCLQGLLEIVGLPYVGSGVRASAIAANKATAKVLFEHHGLPVAPGRLVHSHELGPGLCERLRRELGRGVVTKPVGGGSAIGVSRVTPESSDEDLEQALKTAFAVDSTVLVEVFRQGHEVTCGVLEDPSGMAQALPPTRVVAKAADWYDFTSRYQTAGSEHECPARYRTEVVTRIQEVAVAAHRALDARDLSRVDFVVDHDRGEVTLLEVNTLPGMTPTSLFPEAAAVAGNSFGRLCSELVVRAWQRPRRAAPRVVAMPD